MNNQLCIKCDGRGFNREAEGQILAHEDYAIKADLYKVTKCKACDGAGINRAFGIREFIWCIAGGVFFAVVVLAQFWT